MTKSRAKYYKFIADSVKDQQYYDVPPDMNPIAKIKIDGKEVGFEVVIRLKKPTKNYGRGNILLYCKG